MKNIPLIFLTRINVNKFARHSQRFVGSKFVGRPLDYARGKAFTLIEILIAVFVLEIGLLGIAGFYAYSFKVAKIARNQTMASNLAAGVLDEQISKSYESLIPIDITNYSADPNNSFHNWYKQVEVSCIDADLNQLSCSDASAHMKKITVTISWTEDASAKSFQIATIKSEY